MSLKVALNDAPGSIGHAPLKHADCFGAIDPKRHFAATNYRIAKGLFYHIIGNRAHRRWHLDAECSRSLKIDDELEFGRL